MCRKTNWDRTTRRNNFREKNPSLGRFLQISTEISRFMLQSLGNPQVTSRLVLPLENFLCHLWPRCRCWKHCPGSIECVGKRIVILRRVEMILERKTRTWAVFDQCLGKSSLKTHAFWLYFQGIFHQKTAKIAQEVWNLFQNVQRSFRKVRGRYERRLETSGGVKMMKSEKIAKRHPRGA